jgi:hypothetical protein
VPVDSTTHQIVLADLGRLLADMLEHAIAAADDLVLLARVDSLADASGIGRTAEVDAVVTGVELPELSPACRRLLYDHPRAKVLAVVETLGQTYMYLLRPVQVALGAVSPEEMLQAVRDPEHRAFAS